LIGKFDKETNDTVSSWMHLRNCIQVLTGIS
jgi:hypothetical protein